MRYFFIFIYGYYYDENEYIPNRVLVADYFSGIAILRALCGEYSRVRDSLMKGAAYGLYPFVPAGIETNEIVARRRAEAPAASREEGGRQADAPTVMACGLFQGSLRESWPALTFSEPAAKGV